MNATQEQLPLNTAVYDAVVQVLSAQRPKRGQAWDSARAEISKFIDACENGDAGLRVWVGWGDRDRFLLQMKTYVRALSTYQASSDAWLDMFRAFVLLLHKTGVATPPPNRMQTPAFTMR